MGLKSIGELTGDANVMASIIAKTDSDQRCILYQLVAEKLESKSQNFQALHFRFLTERERGGK